MYRNDDDVEVFVKDVLKKLSVITQQLLRQMIVNKFENTVNDSYIAYVLRKMQNNNELFLTEDGYVLTSGAYIMLSDDKKFNEIHKEDFYSVKKGLNYEDSREGLDAVDCMWLLATMLPDVTEYVINSGVWDLQFIVPPNEEQNSRLYQVVKFKKGFETPKALLLESTCNVENIEDRACIRRIALFDDEEMAFRTPKKLGFNIIAVVDDTQRNHYRILKVIQNSEAW
jgi:hypothetical protein